jgi:hypothetical protein
VHVDILLHRVPMWSRAHMCADGRRGTMESAVLPPPELTQPSGLSEPGAYPICFCQCTTLRAGELLQRYQPRVTVVHYAPQTTTNRSQFDNTTQQAPAPHVARAVMPVTCRRGIVCHDAATKTPEPAESQLIRRPTSLPKDRS